MALMPVLFIGHGNPMNAIVDNPYADGWKRLGESLPRPKAILCISAHWYEPGGRVTGNLKPRTIHDFGGFPPALHAVQYPAPGSRELANRVKSLSPRPIELDEKWGLDHGTWSVLRRMYPNADVPIVQLGLDETMSGHEHFNFARCLRPLRDEDILIVGSGNVVHNLHAYSWGLEAREPYDWALRFEGQVKQLIEAGKGAELANYEEMGKDAMLCAPTPDHFLPLLYVLAQCDGGEKVSFPVEGFDDGSVSMLSVRIG
ncbi:MAG: 4,5-DOPA dioxygenase extradiol [Myxococcaceae bacterium]